MMENITLEFVGEFVAFLVALVGGLGYLNKTLKKWLTKLIEEQQKSINDGLDKINNRLDTLDMETCKDFLVRFLSDVDRGELIDETEKQRFYEQFDHYKMVGGNSYIREKYERLHAKDLI